MSTTTNTTNRLDEIARRDRGGRARDLAFAILIAMLMVLQLSGLRSAARTTATNTADVASQCAAQMQAGSASPDAVASATPVC